MIRKIALTTDCVVARPTLRRRRGRGSLEHADVPDDEAEHRGLGEPGHHVVHDQGLHGAIEVGLGADPEVDDPIINPPRMAMVLAITARSGTAIRRGEDPRHEEVAGRLEAHGAPAHRSPR